MNLSIWKPALLLCAALNSAALACDPFPFPEVQVASAQRLHDLGARSVTCPVAAPTRMVQHCTAYNVPPEQVLPLLAQFHGVTPQRRGPVWQLDTNNGVHLLGTYRGITLNIFRRPQPARERLASELFNALNERMAAWERRNRGSQVPDCAALGIVSNAWYRLESCRIEGRPLEGARVILTLSWVADDTLAARRTIRFGPTWNSCAMYDLF